MQIVRKGIDVPDELIRAHKEGRVVFFCGAGISYEAGLPGFKKLTETIFEKVGERLNSAEKKAADYERWDAVIGSLENRIADRTQVRRKLIEVLTPDRTRPNFTTATHEALLDLATVGGVSPRLQIVTTNFDLLFDSLIKDKCNFAQTYSAPLLPTPRPGLWNGIVYLHGVMPEKYDETQAGNLVLASGDYGRAYLTEAWAARFVAELLRNYVVCFVGYSLSDQTVRYIMDAVEVYNRIGDKTEKVYMFTDSNEPDVICHNKSVVRIPYNPEDCGGNHAILHQTIQTWAKRYKAELDGKRAIVREYAPLNPTEIPDDGYVGQMMWAIAADDDGRNRVLKFFAELDECPNFGWLEVFEKNGFLEGSLFSDDEYGEKSSILGRWILRRMTSREVVLWTIKNQRRLCPQFFRIAESLCNSAQNNDDQVWKLDAFTIRLWRLVLAKKLDDEVERDAFVRLEVDRWLTQGSLDVLKIERLGKLLKPSLLVSASYAQHKVSKDGLIQGPLQDTIFFKIGYSGQYTEYLLKQVAEKFKGRLFEIVNIASEVLEQTLEECTYLFDGNYGSCDAFIDIPSIEDHWQNERGMHAMPYLASIIRDGWLELVIKDRAEARALALKWIRSKHLLIKRFGLFAAKATDVLSLDEWFGTLIEWHGFLLWAPQVKREVMRLFVEKSKVLSPEQLQQLTDALVKGFPACRSIFFRREKEEVESIIDHSKLVRLSKLKKAVVALPKNGEQELARIHEKYPSWTVSDDESDEFACWANWTGDPTEEKEQAVINVPHDVDGLVDWLKADIKKDLYFRHKTKDDFLDVCKECQDNVIAAFLKLGDSNEWDNERIYAALKCWMSKESVAKAAAFVIAALRKMDGEAFGHIANQAASWCEDVVKARLISDNDLMVIGDILLDAEYEWDKQNLSFGKPGDMISTAINHPVGRIMTALIDKSFPETIHKGDGINPVYKHLFEVVLNSDKVSTIHGRLILASRAIAFYYADEEWTRQKLLRYASWDFQREATAFWQGFLWQRSMHIPLLCDLKEPFIATAKHCDVLSDSVHSYVSVFISLILRHQSDFSGDEMAEVIRGMNESQLEDAAKVVESYIRNIVKEGGDVDRSWREDIWPIVCGMWPQDEDKLTRQIQDSLTAALMQTKEVLADGIGAMWFLRAKKVVATDVSERRDYHWLLHRCSESDNVAKYPDVCLEIVYRRLNGIRLWSNTELEKILSIIAKAKPCLMTDQRYKTLKQISDEVRG